MTVLAIIGSTKFQNPEALKQAEELIEKAIKNLKPDLVISGGAVGIDTLGVKIAKKHDINIKEYLPENPRWQPNGFKERNLLIANNCTHLLRIVCKDSKTYGSGWTHDRAKELGVNVLSFSL